MKSAANKRLEQGQRSRERILDAASRLMAARGFAATSIAAISEASGLPASSIYWHFEDKEQVLAAVMERGADQWCSGLPAWSSLPGSPKARLAAALGLVVRTLREEPEFLRLYVLISLERREVDRKSLGVIRRVRETAVGRMRRILAEALGSPGAPLPKGVADSLARFVIAFADGSLIAEHIERKPANLRRRFAHLEVAVSAIAAAEMGKRTKLTIPKGRKPR